MLVRLQTKATKKRRQLFAASVYGAYVVLADASLIRAAASGQLNVVETILITLGLAELNLAIGHSIGRAIKSVVDENQALARADDVNNDNHPQNAQACMRESTHNALNSSAHILCSLTFGTLDIIYLTGVLPISTNTSYAGIATRLAGTASWNAGAWTMLFHSIAHDRKQENHRDTTVKALGIHASIYDLTIQILFLLAAVCYCTQRYSERDINPFGATNIFLWFLANIMGLIDAAYDVHHRNDPLPQAQTPSPRVEVLDDDAEEEASSEVVVESPGSSFNPQ